MAMVKKIDENMLIEFSANALIFAGLAITCLQPIPEMNLQLVARGPSSVDILLTSGLVCHLSLRIATWWRSCLPPKIS